MKRFTGRRIAIAAIALLVVVGLAVVALLEGDVPDFTDVSAVVGFVQGKGYLGAIGLLYLEESGVPMPVPGDFFVMYVGRQTSGQPLLLLAAWLALIATVVAGSSNLYFLAHRFGRKWVEGRLGEIIHVTPERLTRAERAFKRWGVLAIIFGRHIPGLRVPITLVAGTLRTSYPVFAASVAVSSAVWAGVFLIVGVKVGPQVGNFLNAHRSTYYVVGAVVLIAIGYLVFRTIKVLWFSGPRASAADGRTSVPPTGPDLPAEKGS